MVLIWGGLQREELMTIIEAHEDNFFKKKKPQKPSSIIVRDATNTDFTITKSNGEKEAFGFSEDGDFVYDLLQFIYKSLKNSNYF